MRALRSAMEWLGVIGRPARVIAVVGDEYDAALFARLHGVLLEMGATATEERFGIGGERFLTENHYRIGRSSVVLATETDRGLSITGDENIVERILHLSGCHPVTNDGAGEDG
ncbi:hypothetical protein [Methylobrevis albus]|uniref:Uncharacterized protein n=1 Tax=Methylobrevis albus TaxID=2793297 RepID=A0A931I319_9HYPH|nr:hypothetical protein [Methylobrevis albus]MBH0237996.1 hypothetical protein [Methylobrevis albus]